ncbi:PAS domain-containing protein [Ktedonospora formicarum]|uniref:PAS domain-containing protein n=1 Tax=Ktedonospora formicarum TaxID=2778364 RepID=A0A8J3I2K7_9CHLR|nr:PAS domain-containing protein [Ktedonospora formicarum]GHO46441.1 hypothetical protein KSX_46040 [Ktedonospora formicarum]
MGKSLQHVTQHKPKRDGAPGGKPITHARSLGGAHKQRNHLEAIWESFPEGLIACDRHQRIVRINAAACRLFEVGSESQYQGRNYQQFLTSYIRSDEQPSCVSGEQWLLNLVLAGATGAGLQAQTLRLHLPSGRTILVTVRSFSVSDQERDVEETVSVFQELTHGLQDVSQLQRAHEAMLELIAAIEHIPEQVDLVLPEETFLLSPPVLFVAQQVANVIRSVLNCHRVNMLAFGHPTGHLYFVAGSGYTAEHEL